MPDDDSYAYCETLTRDQWAWEFLRRNPDYRSDYRQFIKIWRALEADYGAPPHRDFARWKQDPRAYGPLPGQGDPDAMTGQSCAGEDDRALLECWLGAKWGFYKFPLDPACVAPGPDELSWRPPPQPNVDEIKAPYRIDIAFDLSLPLPGQLEAAKFRLVSRVAELRRQGLAAPQTVSNQLIRWRQLLGQLDAKTTGKAVAETNAPLRQEAEAMARDGYLHILRLADSRPDLEETAAATR